MQHCRKNKTLQKKYHKEQNNNIKTTRSKTKKKKNIKAIRGGARYQHFPLHLLRSHHRQRLLGNALRGGSAGGEGGLKGGEVFLFKLFKVFFFFFWGGGGWFWCFFCFFLVNLGIWELFFLFWLVGWFWGFRVLWGTCFFCFCIFLFLGQFGELLYFWTFYGFCGGWGDGFGLRTSMC